MLQLFQQVKSGKTELREVPIPAILPGRLLVRTQASLVSAGTEKMLLDFTKKNLLEKARSRPDLVKQVLEKASREGWLATLKTVRNRLDAPLPMGYSAAGIIEAAPGTSRFQVGQRVAIAGAGYANHAEFNCVPANLVVPIPGSVTFEEAAYCTVASIALQGVRITQPTLGEVVGVIGLGLIGLITVQLLKANGCRVVGIDPDTKKLELARTLGLDLGLNPKSEDVFQSVEQFSQGRGLDRVLITASTKSNQPVEMAGKLSRHRGTVTVVGGVRMVIPRDLYYKKELDVRLSMSYGPGRYDATYEEGGIDYPYPYVRWTENRNMQAVLALIAQASLKVAPLTTHRFSMDSALEAYALLEKPTAGYVGVILDYPERPSSKCARVELTSPRESGRSVLGVSFIGAGNYATQFLLPLTKSSPLARLQGLVTSSGITALSKAEKFGFMFCATDPEEVFSSKETSVVFVATRHDSHCDYVLRSLDAGKDVFVEKPVVVDSLEAERLMEALRSHPARKLMVGLNRRFSPHIQEIRAQFSGAGPLQILYRVNAGAIPPESWVQSSAHGGGMLISEMCHFIDVGLFLTRSKPTRVEGRSLMIGRESVNDFDNICANVTFENGSLFTLVYSTLGDKAAPKERLEIFGGGQTAILEDFRRLEIFKSGSKTVKTNLMQDKGQKNMIQAALQWFSQGGESCLPIQDAMDGMEIVFAIQASLTSGKPISLGSVA